MPQDLAALLVEEGAVSQADMERAVARQAQEGGALDTALLELELVGEGHLRSFLSHASGLPAVPPGALAEVDPRARRVFPARVAERHRLAPFALDGRELSVVAVHPLDAAAIDEIGFMLSLTLVPHVALEWRVHELIQRLYGGQMPARLARLAEREQQRQGAGAPAPVEVAPPVEAAPVAATALTPPPAEVAEAIPSPPAPAQSQSLEDAFFAAGEAGAYSAPGAPADSAAGAPAPESAEPPPQPAEPIGAAPTPGDGEGEPPRQAGPALPAAADEASFAGLDDSDTAIVAPESPRPPEPEPTEPPLAEPSTAPAPAAADPTSFAEIEPARRPPSGFARDANEPAEPLLAALELAVDAYDALWADATPEPSAQLPAEEAPEVVVPPPTEEPAAVAEGAAEPVGAVEAAAEPGSEEEAEEPELPPAQLDRSAPPRWAVEDALGALASAVHRDEVVLTALRFARDFFEFSALFAVTRDAVVGHDALGSQEDPRPHARGTAIYAEDPGIVRTVLETRAPYLGPVVRDAVGTTNILDGLWRGTPRTVLLYPILVGDRPVAVLYADNGEAPVSARRLGDLLLFLSTVGGTFERIIRARKKRRPRGAPRPTPAAPPPASVPEDSIASEPAPSWMAPPPEPEDQRPEPPAPALAEVPVPEAANEPTAVPAEDPSEVPPVEESIPPDAPSPSTAAEEGPEGGGAPPAAQGREGAEPSADEGVEGEQGPPAGEVAPPQAEADGRLERAIALLLAGGKGPPDRVAPIVDLLLDPDPGQAAAARDALAELRAHAALKPVPERLRRGLLSGVGDRPVLAALALGALRDVESIPILIQAFEGGSPEGARAAAEALTRITLQRLGPSAQKWLRWWKENRGRSRAEWLFAALTAAESDLRAAAAAELREAGSPPVHYSPDLPASELASAARSWWTWWSHQGFRI